MMVVVGGGLGEEEEEEKISQKQHYAWPLQSGGSNRPIGLRVGESPSAPCRVPLWLLLSWEICLPVERHLYNNPTGHRSLGRLYCPSLKKKKKKKKRSRVTGVHFCPLLVPDAFRGAKPAPLFLSVGQHTPNNRPRMRRIIVDLCFHWLWSFFALSQHGSRSSVIVEQWLWFSHCL
ncbi:hypothetical protein T10_2131 [Trichinella papuae]|nr:hypothetical protein T10_2131 [Trichinella papuae]